MTMKKLIVKNVFYGDEMTIEQISRPLKIYYNSNHERYFNYKKKRYYLNDIYSLDYPYTNGLGNLKISGYRDSYFFPFYVQFITRGYDEKIVLYARVQKTETI